MITNAQSGTNIHEIADGIYRINTPIHLPAGAFSFNQYLIVDEKPMIFHTGPRSIRQHLSGCKNTLGRDRHYSPACHDGSRSSVARQMRDS